jgi:predicted nucleic acid-binding protein
MSGFEWLPALDEDGPRAFDVQQELCSPGQMRAVGFPALLVAAIAERHRLTRWHCDSDFDLVQAMTSRTWDGSCLVVAFRNHGRG